MFISSLWSQRLHLCSSSIVFLVFDSCIIDFLRTPVFFFVPFFKLLILHNEGRESASLPLG